jgi:hypothetical protein
MEVLARTAGCMVNFSFAEARQGGAVAQAGLACLQDISASISANDVDSLRTVRYMQLWAAMVAAVAAAGSSAATSLITQTATWVLQAPQTVAMSAAISLKQIVDSSQLLRKEAGAVQRPLFRARNFRAAMAVLLPLDATLPSASTLPPGRLLAICAVLPSLSVAVLLEKFDQYKPFLTTALGFGLPTTSTPLLPYCAPQSPADLPAGSVESVLRAAATSVLHAALLEQPALLQDCVSDVVPKLLAVASMQHTRSPLIRVLAIDALTQIAQLKHATLFPLRDGVLRGLSLCVDDAKRAVRRRAVVARNVWSVLSA